MLSKVLTYFAGTITDSENTLKQLYEDKLGVAYSFLAVTGFLLLYTAVIYVFHLAGGKASLTPWFSVPADQYYPTQLFFQWPVFLSLLVLFAGLLYVFSKAWSLSGDYNKCLMAAGFILAVPATCVILPFYLILLLAFAFGAYSPAAWSAFTATADGVNFIYLLLLIASLWGLELSYTAVKQIFSAPPKKALVVSIASGIILAFFLLTYLR